MRADLPPSLVAANDQIQAAAKARLDQLIAAAREYLRVSGCDWSQSPGLSVVLEVASHHPDSTAILLVEAVYRLAARRQFRVFGQTRLSTLVAAARTDLHPLYPAALAGIVVTLDVLASHHADNRLVLTQAIRCLAALSDKPGIVERLR
jgi:hypothetical protein